MAERSAPNWPPPSASRQGLLGKAWGGGGGGGDAEGTHRSPCPGCGRRCCASHPGSSRRCVSRGTLREVGWPLYRAKVDLNTHHPLSLSPSRSPPQLASWDGVAPVMLPSPSSSPTLGHCLLEDEGPGEVGAPYAGELNVGVQVEDGVYVEATGPTVGEGLPPGGGEPRAVGDMSGLALATMAVVDLHPYVPAITGRPPAAPSGPAAGAS